MFKTASFAYALIFTLFVLPYSTRAGALDVNFICDGRVTPSAGACLKAGLALVQAHCTPTHAITVNDCAKESTPDTGSGSVDIWNCRFPATDCKAAIFDDCSLGFSLVDIPANPANGLTRTRLCKPEHNTARVEPDAQDRTVFDRKGPKKSAPVRSTPVPGSPAKAHNAENAT